MSWETEKEKAAREIVTLLYENRMIRTFYRDRPEGWTLISGLYSPMYIQLRPMASYPLVFENVCRAMARMIREETPQVTRIVGIAMAGVPIAAGMALCGGLPAGFTRKMENVKTLDAFNKAIAQYGEHSLVEGALTAGDNIALVDDLVTRFDSKLIALEQVRREVTRRKIPNVGCRTVAVVLDREQGGQAAAQKAGLDLVSLIPFKSLGLPLLKGALHPQEWDILSRYLDNPDLFQDTKVQEEIRSLAQPR